MGKIDFVLGLLTRDNANHSYAPNTPLTQALNPLSSDTRRSSEERKKTDFFMIKIKRGNMSFDGYDDDDDVVDVDDDEEDSEPSIA